MLHRQVSIFALLAVAGSAGTAPEPGTQTDAPLENNRSLVQRAPVEPAGQVADQGANRGDSEHRRGGNTPPAVFPNEYRSINGWGNNQVHKSMGTVGIEMLRMMPNAYDDGVGVMPARSTGPSPRLISNLVANQTKDMPNPAGASDYLWQWGQFLDHDIDETPVADPAIPMDIPVPAGDQWFDPFDTGMQTIGFDRSAFRSVNGAREQLNNITAFIDASMVYGSEDKRAHELRALDGTGRIRTSEGDLLPFNTNGFDNAPTAHDPSFFLAGDVRANEQIALTAMHTLFMREHNHHADRIRAARPDLPADDVYEHARAIVAAEIQWITYNEFLPLLLGSEAIPPYDGYKPQVDPGIGNVFATAAYRVGHTMLSSTLRRLDRNNQMIDAGHVALANGFFAPQLIIDEGIDPVLRGLASQRAQTIDTKIIDDVRNFLFGPPGAGGFDLASLNIQRGRDHGIPGINTIRAAYGMPPLPSIAALSDDPDIRAALELLYGDVEEVDPWIALLAEPHAPGALVGPTLQRVLADQFQRLRDGDRFWFQSYLPQQMAQRIEQQTLARVIRRNTGIGAELPDNVFRIGTACVADIDENGILDLEDVQLFINAFVNTTSVADIDGNSIFDLADIQAFIATFNAGCP